MGRPGDGPGELRTPMGLDMSADGRIAVADTGNHRIQFFDSEGRFLSSIGEVAGFSFGRPMDVAFAVDGSLWVADFQHDALYRITPRGDLVERRTGDAAPASPAGIAVLPDGRLAVTSFYDHALHLYTGEAHIRVGSEGTGPDGFHYPTGVSVGREGGLLVADSYNHRLQLLDGDGRLEHSFRGAEGTPLRVPVAAAMTPGVVHVADSENHRVVAIDAQTGAELAEWRIVDAGSGAHTPSRIVSHGDRLYVTDSANHVVLVLARANPTSPRAFAPSGPMEVPHAEAKTRRERSVSER
ncbi:MAG: NHL repeat-containing protein [Deltaproteobacteria bacterium]|nr:NHL repeat-containing protein [Deltaproteobacteria bacterium]